MKCSKRLNAGRAKHHNCAHTLRPSLQPGRSVLMVSSAQMEAGDTAPTMNLSAFFRSAKERRLVLTKKYGNALNNCSNDTFLLHTL